MITVNAVVESMEESPSPALPDTTGGDSADHRSEDRQQLRGAALTVGGQAVSSATTFLRMVLIARVCTAADVGLYAMAFTGVMFMFATHERLIESGYVMCVHRRNGRQQHTLLGSTIVISICFSLLGSVIVALAGLGAAAFGRLGWMELSPAMASALWATALALPPIVFRELARTVSYAHFEPVNAVVVDAITFVVQLTILALLWGTGTLGVETTYLAIGISSLAASLWWVGRWRDRWQIIPSHVAADWREMWDVSRWLLAARALGLGSRTIMPWVVAAYMGAASAGVLAASITLVGVSWIFVRGVNNYFRPIAVYAYQHGGPSALRRAVWQPSLLFIAILGGLCVVYGVAGDWLYELAFGSRPHDIWLVVLLQGIATLAISLVAVATNGLAAIDRPRANLWIEGLSMVVTLGMAVALIPPYGLVGASAAMMAGCVASGILAFALLERELNRLDPRSPQRRGLRADIDKYAAPSRT